MARTNLRILSQADVLSILSNTPSSSLLALMSRTFHTFSTVTSAAQVPHRTTVQTGAHTVLFMPARLEGVGTAVKVVSVPARDQRDGIPATTMLLDEETGEVKAVVNARALTAMRTAAGSAIATLHLSSPTSTHLLVFGSGAQALAHIDLILNIRPTITHVTVWNRSAARVGDLVSSLHGRHEALTFRALVGETDKDDLMAAVQEADIICTCTNSSTPLFQGRWIKPGAHLNCVGSYTLSMEEVDQDTVGRARVVVVDSVEACKIEAGEFVREVKEGRRTVEDGWVEIGNLVDNNGKVIEQVKERVRPNQEQDVTIFKSVGISVQDCAIAGWVVGRAEESGVGVVVEY